MYKSNIEILLIRNMYVAYLFYFTMSIIIIKKKIIPIPFLDFPDSYNLDGENILFIVPTYFIILLRIIWKYCNS